MFFLMLKKGCQKINCPLNWRGGLSHYREVIFVNCPLTSFIWSVFCFWVATSCSVHCTFTYTVMFNWSPCTNLINWSFFKDNVQPKFIYYYSTKEWNDWLIQRHNWLIDWLTVWLIIYLIDWLFDWLFIWLIDCLID